MPLSALEASQISAAVTNYLEAAAAASDNSAAHPAEMARLEELYKLTVRRRQFTRVLGQDEWITVADPEAMGFMMTELARHVFAGLAYATYCGTRHVIPTTMANYIETLSQLKKLAY